MKYGIVFGLFTLLSVMSYGQSCEQKPSESQLRIETLASNLVGNAFDVDADQAGRVYWVERTGKFKVYFPNEGSVTEITSNVPSVSSSKGNWNRNNEGGLQGIALDGNFLTTRWVYLYYSVSKSVDGNLSTEDATERLARITLTPNGKGIVPGSEKTILELNLFDQCCHHGGDLAWGADGNLWLSVGDNINPANSNGSPRDGSVKYKDVRGTSGNSNDLRGKVLRIKPIAFADTESPSPGIGSTYEIPQGNLFESTTEYPVRSKVREEVYAMGFRNPFSIQVSPYEDRPGVAVGEAGSSESNAGDEINVAVEPGFFGWPYFGGNNVALSGVTSGANKVVTNNSSHNTGIQQLPPAKPSLYNKSTPSGGGMNCMGVVGPWTSHDTANPNTAKMPPYMENTLLVTSYAGNKPLELVKLNAQGQAIKNEVFLSSATMSSKLGAIHRSVQGRDGALYFAVGQYTFNNASASKIVKISYTGTCSPYKPVVASIGKQYGNVALQPFLVSGLQTSISVPENVSHVSVFNLSGKKVWESNKVENQTLKMPSSLEGSVFYVQFQ